MIAHVGIAFSSNKFDCKKREEIADGRNHFASRQSCLLNNLGNIQLLNEWGKNENAGILAVMFSVVPLAHADALRCFRNFGALYGESDFQTGSARKF